MLKGLLPYYLLLLVFLIGFVLTASHARTRTSWLALLSSWLVVSTGVIAVVFGLGHYWSVASLIGKTVALIGGNACPFLGAMVVILGLRARKICRSAQNIGGLIGGIAGGLFSPFVGLFLACALTGDCL